MSWVWTAGRGGGGGGPPVPSDGVAWGIIYDVDFTAQTPVASYTPGGYLIDRKQWWLKGTLVQGGGVVQSSSLSAAGLNLTVNFSSEGTDAATNLRWFARLSELTDRYNSRAPLALWFRSVTSDAAGPSSSQAICGFCNGAESSASLSAAERLTRIGLANSTAAVTSAQYWSNNSTGGVALGAVPTGAGRKLMVEVLNNYAQFNGATWTPDASDPYTVASGTSLGNAFQSRNAHTKSTLGVYFGTNFNGGSTQTMSLMRLQIMQPINQ